MDTSISTSACIRSADSTARPAESTSRLQPSPIPLSPRKASRNFHHHASSDPPVTPPPRSKSKSMTKLAARSSSKPNTDTQHPTSPSVRPRPQADPHAPAASRAPQHSHGLSWNSTTRDSVVDNLLFSLGNLSRQDVGEAEGEQEHAEKESNRFFSSLASQFDMNRSSLRSRGHTQSSSISDYDRRVADSPASKCSGRRSNSSANLPAHHSLASRMKSGAKAFSSGRRRTSSEVQRGNPHHIKQTSDGSDIEVGYGAVLEASRLAFNGKSLSMDHMHASPDASSVLGRGRPVPSVHSRYDSYNDGDEDGDAAPEPSIAGGPRKMQNPTATGPVYVNAASKTKPNTVRKTNTQTDLRELAGNLPSPPIPQDIRNQAADFVRAGSMRTNIPPPSEYGAAPSPSVARREPSPPRERPGFFKRVFGSSRAVSSPIERPGSNQIPQGVEELNASTRAISQASMGPSSNLIADAASIANGTASQTPTLNKKPSSFFRRRKKSVSEATRPPPLPMVSNSTMKVKAAEPSPSISSLRKVMDPYLSQNQNGQGDRGLAVPKSRGDTSRPDTSDSRVEDSEDPDIFHTGYTKSPDASLVSRKPIPRDLMFIDSGSSPESKMKTKSRHPDMRKLSDFSQPTLPIDGPDRQLSVASTLDEQPKVSPISERHIELPINQTPVSPPSTSQGLTTSRENSPIQPHMVRSFSGGTGIDYGTGDDDWLVTRAALERPTSGNPERLVLKPTLSEEKLNSSLLNDSPGKRPTRSHRLEIPTVTENMFEAPSFDVSPSLLLPSFSVEHSKKPGDSDAQVASELIDDGAEYRERARRIFDGNEEDVSKSDAAAWMGERNMLSTRTLQAYMRLFDFSGLNILTSLRMLCVRLILKGETQQFDRIITALSSQWCECNPNHGFKAQDVVHTIIYSVILLNTDLHLADIGEKMSRSAYVKNTLPTIRRVVADAAPNAFDDTVRPATQQLRPPMPWNDSNASAPVSPTFSAEPDFSTMRSDTAMGDYTPLPSMSSRRMSTRPGFPRMDSDSTMPDPTSSTGPINLLVNSPWTGPMRAWESEIETVLKSFFNSIRGEPLPLHGAIADSTNSNKNLSVVDLNNTLKRTGSIVSRATSDNMSFRSKQDFRSMTMKWQGRANRSRPKVYPASTVASSRTSFDDGSGFWSPAQSSRSFSKTLTSASVGSFGPFTQLDPYKHSIGFANALSQAIIREENQPSDSEVLSVPGGLLEDDGLALEGAPWAKEGMIKHKHHMETQDRKAKDRNWTECFAVLSNGKLTLFAFNTSGKTQSLGRKSHMMRSGKAASVTGARVGGGDWMENAEQLDVFVLRQTIASTLPPPGYSKVRPHVWALSLPSGAVHLFQVGTPEIAKEFMTTANYWSARLSKEPLAGGISNIEYGWSENIINPALLERSESFQHPPSSMQTRGHAHSMSTERGQQRSSVQSSMRSSFDTGFGGVKPRLPGDKVSLQEWQPPTQSMMASQLLEIDQLRQLTAYVHGQEEELEKHNELKHAIELAFSTRHPNFNKAMTNWQRKSDYLLREIVKFRTYIDSLSAAQKAKEEYYARKAEGRLSPVAKRDDDFLELPNISGSLMIGEIEPRGIRTAG